MQDLRVLYQKFDEQSNEELFTLFSNLIQSNRKYFNEIIFLRIEKTACESFLTELLFGVTSRLENQAMPNALEIQSILESLLLLDFTDQGYMFLGDKKRSDFDAAIKIHESEDAYFIAFFNETQKSLDEVGATGEELDKLFSNLTIVMRKNLVKYCKERA